MLHALFNQRPHLSYPTPRGSFKILAIRQLHQGNSLFDWVVRSPRGLRSGQSWFSIDDWIERQEGDDGIMDIDEQILWHVGRSDESFWIDDDGVSLCTPIEFQGQQDFVLLLIEQGFRVNDLVVVDVLFDP